MESLDQQYLNAMQMMKEDDFTKDILKPLFQAMGYERVDFNGGPLERGRDLIAEIRVPPRKTPRVIYIQSKKIDGKQNTKESAKFTQLVHQLRQCFTQKVTTLDGREVKADDIYIACPEQITNRFMEEVSSQLYITGKEIIPYDGPAILSDIKEFLPELLKNLVSIDKNLLKTNNSDLINRELLSALKSKKDISLTQFYSDLNFFVGSVDSNLLMHLKPEVKIKELKIPKNNWEPVRKEVLDLIEKHDINLLNKEILDIEASFNKELSLYEEKENQDRIAGLFENKKSYHRIKEELLIDLKLVLKLLSSGLDKNLSSMVHSSKNYLIDNVSEEVVEQRFYISNKMLSIIEEGSFDDLDKLDEVPEDDDFHPKFLSFLETAKSLKKLNEEIDSISEGVILEPKYLIELDSERIIKHINKIVSDYLDSVVAINSGQLVLEKIKDFLNNTESTLSMIYALRSLSTELSECIEFKYERDCSDRVSISPHDIFSTGHDIAVYGGAGVGKTTTLQAYVSNVSENERKIIVYIPLNRMIEKYREQFEVINSSSMSKELIQKIILMSKGQSPTDDNVSKLNLLLDEPLTVVLDGLDEVYNTIPFILKSITEFKSKFKNAQLIISSRDCVSYLQDIDFLGITLLPFTRNQLNRFILGWIEDSNKASLLIKSIESKDLYEHVKTPLLATIACSLVERGIDAPSSEFEIYSERLRLLTGEYDNYKNIQRQNNKGDFLRLCARKIAFAMHRINIRSVSIEKAYSLLRKEISSSYDDKLLKNCLVELENPCNIFIKDRLTGNYSFGHFRFQEHLVSLELSSNRNIDLSELTSVDWWRGALDLYAQENEIFHLFEDVYNKFGSIKKSKITLVSMIFHSPKNRRKALNDLLIRYEESDRLDNDILGINEFNNFDDMYGYNF